MSKREELIQDLTGKKFGRWTVEYMVDRKEPGSQLKRLCHCRCECGREKDVYYHNLINGRSSGCGYCYTGGYRIDLTGKTIGELKILNYDRNTGKWNCKCSCGSFCQKATGYLRNPKAKNVFCGNMYKHPALMEKVSTEDLTGMEFDDLTVLYRLPDRVSPNGRKHHMWRCRCKCGNELDVYGFQLRTSRNMPGSKPLRCPDCNREIRHMETELKQCERESEKILKRKKWMEERKQREKKAFEQKSEKLNNRANELYNPILHKGYRTTQLKRMKKEQEKATC